MHYTSRRSTIGHLKTIAGLPYIITLPWTYRRERWRGWWEPEPQVFSWARCSKVWWPGLRGGLIYPARTIPSSSDVSDEAPWKPPMAPTTCISTAAITWEGSKNPVKPCLVSGALVSLKADQYARGRPWGHTWVMLECFRTPEWNLYVLYCYTSASNPSSGVGLRLCMEPHSGSYDVERIW